QNGGPDKWRVIRSPNPADAFGLWLISAFPIFWTVTVFVIETEVDKRTPRMTQGVCTTEEHRLAAPSGTLRLCSSLTERLVKRPCSIQRSRPSRVSMMCKQMPNLLPGHPSHG